MCENHCKISSKCIYNNIVLNSHLQLHQTTLSLRGKKTVDHHGKKGSIHYKRYRAESQGDKLIIRSRHKLLTSHSFQLYFFSTV